MSGWYLIAVVAVAFWAGLIVGVLAAALAGANRRGGQIDLTGVRGINVVNEEPVRGVPEPGGLPRRGFGGKCDCADALSTSTAQRSAPQVGPSGVSR